MLRAFVKARRVRTDISQAERALHTKSEGLLNLWNQQSATPTRKPTAKSTENRSQIVLREAIDKVQQGRYASITDEDVQLLRATQEVLPKSAQPGKPTNTRLHELLTSTVNNLELNVAKLIGLKDRSVFESVNPTAGRVQSARPTNNLTAADDFTNIQKSALSSLAGIATDLHLRSFEFTGDTVVSGDIPNDVLLTISNGNLTVNGFVAGHLVADNDIVVHGNVQGGSLISYTGSIRLQRSLMGATLVSKRGSVTCEHLESPKRAFAWDTFHVQGPCISGKVIAGNVTVEGKVHAAELRSCGQIKVASIESSKNTASTILLASQITCEEYDLAMTDELKDKSRQVPELLSKIDQLEKADQYVNHLILNTHRTALFYLLGGTQNAAAATDLQSKQLKALYLSQLIAFACTLSNFYSKAHQSPQDFDAECIADFSTLTQDSFKMLKKDIEAIPEYFGAAQRRYLIDRTKEYTYLERSLLKYFEQDHDDTFLKTTYPSAISTWREELGSTERDIQERINSFGLDAAVLAKIEGEPEALENFLATTIEEKLQSSDSLEAQHAQSPLIRILQTMANRNRRSIENNHTVVKSAHSELVAYRKELEVEAAVKFAENYPGACALEAQKMVEGTVVTASRLSKKGRDTAMARVIVIENPVNATAVFHLKGGVIQRQGTSGSKSS